MSYSKHHFVYKALDKYQNLGSDQHHLYMIVFIAFLAKKNNLSVNLSIKEIVEQSETKVFPKDFLLKNLQVSGNFCINETLDPFENVSIEELADFLCDRDLFSLEKDTSFGQYGQPSGLNDLLCRLFNFNSNDTLLDIGSGLSTFLNYVSKNYDLATLDGIEKYSLIYIYGNILPEIEDSNIRIFLDDVFNHEYGKTYTKVFTNPPFGGTLDSELNKKQINYVESIIGCETREIMIGFILKAIELLSEDGKAIICVPPIAQFGDSAYLDLRKYLIDNKLLEAVIELPSGVFHPYASGVKTSLLILSKKKNDNVLFMNAALLCQKPRIRGRGLLMEDVNNIYELYVNEKHENSSIKKVVSCKKIKDNNYYCSSNKYLLEPIIELRGINNYLQLSKLLTTKIIRGSQYKAEELDKKETNLPTDSYYLSVKNIQDGKIDSDLSRIDFIEEKYSKLILEENDLVMGMIISEKTKIALVDNLKGKKIIPANNIYIIRPNKDLINPLFLKMILESDRASLLFQTFASGASLPSISVEFLNNLMIPLPDMKTQKELETRYRNIEIEQEALKNRLFQLSTEKNGIISLFNEGKE